MTRKIPLGVVFAVVLVGLVAVGYVAALVSREGPAVNRETERADKLHREHMRRIR